MIFSLRQLAASYRVGVGKTSRSHDGFTLLEMMIVVVVIGILMTMGALTWISFLANHELRSGQDEVYLAVRQAQETARRNNLAWQIGFRITPEQTVQWATFPTNGDRNQAHWQTLTAPVLLSPKTTLSKSGDIYKVAFNHKGHVNGQLGKVILTSRSDSRKLRCVVVSTLLGAMRKGDTSSQCSSN